MNEKENAEERSRNYKLLSIGFSYPGTQLEEAFELGLAKELESDYVALFDGGQPGLFKSPYEGLWDSQKKRGELLHEVLMFYKHFGLEIGNELPDHAALELEFMHFLTFKEAEARNDSKDFTPYLKAQEDFFTRHLNNWLPDFCESLIKVSPNPFYRKLGEITIEFLCSENEYLK